jgi:hypothetical protein
MVEILIVFMIEMILYGISEEINKPAPYIWLARTAIKREKDFSMSY